MFTIRQALNLPIFEESKLIAGEAGLEQPIQWASVRDAAPDKSFLHRESGVLILATDVLAQQFTEPDTALIPSLKEKGAIAAVLSIPQDADSIPPQMIVCANEENFPLIRLPAAIPPKDLYTHVISAVVNPDYLYLQKSKDIHQELTKVVLKGGKLGDLTQIIANKLNRSTVIEDTSLRVLAHSLLGPLDPMRKSSVLRERNHPRIAKKLLSKGIYDRLKQELQPVLVPPMPEIGMTLGRLVAPIVVDRDIYGYFWIISNGEERELIETVAVQAATIAALMMFKERTMAEAEATLRTSFFEEIISPSPHTDPKLLLDQARRLNFPLDTDHQILLVHGMPASGGNPRPLLNDIGEWTHASRLTSLLHWHEDHVIIIQKSRDPDQVGAKMIEEMSHPARELMVGIGNRYNGADGIQKSYQQALEALTIAKKMGKTQGVFLFSDLGLLHWLHLLPEEALEGNIYLHYIDALSKHDRRRNTELVKTLEGYLDNGSNLVDTAKALHIHRNTLVHRLRRIEELTDLDLKKAGHRLNLHVAVKQYRLGK
ncbi:MAG: helix-turn-helix domain-containing protein [Chloroflexota bacterium]